MIIIIPLGGKGERFKKEGYKLPKPLVKVLGKEIICWVIESLDLSYVDKIVIPYNKELEKYRFDDFIKHKFPKLNIITFPLHEQTEGATETVLLALNKLTNLELVENIMCIDGDNFYLDNIVDKYIKSENKNVVYYFKDDTPNPIYSYIFFIDDKIYNIVEKTKISDFACTGCYCFESGIILKEYCKKIIEQNIRQKGEFYISGIIYEMIKEHKFTGIEVNYDSYICLGTPLHVKIFCNNIPKNMVIGGKSPLLKELRICFDLDNTLVTFPKVHGDYTTVEPIMENIELLRYFKKLGHIIIINTARRMKTHNSNQGRVLADIGKITFDTLEKMEIPYDEIYFGKPEANVYIDDLAINCYENIEKEMGFYKSNIDPRSFNNLEKSSINTIIKKSDKKLDGEIYWYLNKPASIKDMFPMLIRYDENEYKYYEMERIIGFSVSKMFIHQDITCEILQHILNSLERIHNSEDNKQNINKESIYLNYTNKLKERYITYDYAKFDNSEKLYEYLIRELELYEKNDMGDLKVIHGDPVLTNIMINQFNKLKFFDMRGKLGNILTIYGDSNYDYAKLYQSLCGYDEILLNTMVKDDYRNKLIKYFEEYIVNKYGSERLKYIKLITSSLFFTLIPLHDDEEYEKLNKYYKLAYKIIFYA